MTLTARLQAYLHHAAAVQYESLPLPPFTLYFHHADAFPHFNYAIPASPPGPQAAQALAALRAAFAARGRQPRFEFIEDFAPALPALLAEAGFVDEGRNPLMVCTPATLQEAAPVPGLQIVQVDARAPLSFIQEVLAVQRQGFGHDDTATAGIAEAEQRRASLDQGWTWLARRDGHAVGAGSVLPAVEGVAELAGIATPPRFRNQGIASALTAHATRDAFARGVDLAMLSAGDERAAHVYARVGYQIAGMMRAFSEQRTSAEP